MTVGRWRAKVGWGTRAAQRFALLGVACVLAALLGGRAQAQIIFSGDNITYSEAKFGIWAHDPKFLEGKERGVDFNPELIVQSPIPDAWAASVPWWIRWTTQPRPTIGGSVNSAGDTDQFYLGATWTWQLWQNVLRPGDGITASLFWGPGFNDGLTVSNSPNRKSLGSHILYREAIEFGYQVTPIITLSAYIDHLSNAGASRFNQSINDVGGRIGIRF